jgi:hypothetical protein
MSVTQETQELNTLDELHIIILVAGTSDPVNTTISTKDFKTAKGRANSYDSVSKYWDKDFFTEIMKFQKATKENKAMIVFDKHGWSGDNSIENRAIAGAYLVNRLCGEEGLTPYYKKYLNTPVRFHLLGHSHGGNVINEMTKQMEKLGDKWPEKWKVKSLIYLSTPFFNKLHQVSFNEKFYDEDAEVLHMHCDFDLTQRMLADFSMEFLGRLMISNEMQNLGNVINKLQKFEFPKISTKLEDVDDRWYGVDLELTISYREGKEFYSKFIELFNNVENVFDELRILINKFSEESEFEVSDSIKEDLGEDILQYKRTIIKPDSSKKIVETIERIIIEISKNRNNFENRYKIHEDTKQKYLLKNIFEDFEINSLVELLINFLDINPITLAGKDNSLWNIVYKFLDENIEEYDDTYIKPDEQFKSTPLASKITDIDVTSRDKYFDKPENISFYKFIKYIKTVEDNYSKDANQTNLLDLIFALIVGQVGKGIHSYKGVGFGSALKGFANAIKVKRWSDLDFSASEFEKRVFELANMVTNYQTIFKRRDFGNILDKSHILTEKEKKDKVMQRGSIPYLLIESHSTSRRVLHSEVKELLNKLGPKR